MNGCDPEAALCFGMAPNGEFLRSGKIATKRHQNIAVSLYSFWVSLGQAEAEWKRA